MTSFSPREIVSELDRYIVGQNDAKRAVELLRDQHGAAPSPEDRTFHVGAKRQVRPVRWWRTALEAGAILALASLLALGFFVD